MNCYKKQNTKNCDSDTSTAFIFIIIGLLILINNPVASAEQSQRKTTTEVSYKIADGYGEYTGVGSTKIAAQSMARTACIMNKVASYENSHNGSTPDEDTVDLFFDACINR